MTPQEFEAYLHSIGGLKNGYKEDDYITSCGYFSFGDGWLQLTRDLIEDLIALGWDKVIYQAKEKFGGGRFYIGSATNEVFARIEKWTADTFKTCEICGTQENVTTNTSGWYSTECDNCRQSPSLKQL